MKIRKSTIKTVLNDWHWPYRWCKSIGFWQYSTLMSLISITSLLLPPPLAGARDLVRIFNNVSTSTDVCLTRILRHPLNKILLPPIFFTESFAITPTTLALLGAQVGTVCICLFQNDLKRKLAKLLPGQSDQTSLKPLDVKWEHCNNERISIK